MAFINEGHILDVLKGPWQEAVPQTEDYLEQIISAHGECYGNIVAGVVHEDAIDLDDEELIRYRLVKYAPEMAELLYRLSSFLRDLAEEGKIDWDDDAPVVLGHLETAEELLSTIIDDEEIYEGRGRKGFPVETMVRLADEGRRSEDEIVLDLVTDLLLYAHRGSMRRSPEQLAMMALHHVEQESSFRWPSSIMKECHNCGNAFELTHIYEGEDWQNLNNKYFCPFCGKLFKEDDLEGQESG